MREPVIRAAELYRCLQRSFWFFPNLWAFQGSLVVTAQPVLASQGKSPSLHKGAGGSHPRNCQGGLVFSSERCSVWLLGEKLVLTVALALLLCAWVPLSSAGLLIVVLEGVQSVSLLFPHVGTCCPHHTCIRPCRPCLNLDAKEVMPQAAPTYGWACLEIVTHFLVETM